MFKKLFTTQKEQKRELIDPYNLQLFLGLCGILLPFLCILIGKIVADLSIQVSISAYYHTVSQDVFVGTLCIFAACFISYNGYNLGEQYLGKIMGLLALCIAVFPSENLAFPDKPVGMFQLQPELSSVIHFTAAALLFFFLGLFSIFFFTKSDKPPEKRTPIKKINNVLFRVFGVAIWGCGLFTFISVILLSEEWVHSHNIIFWMETVMLISFGATWLAKSKLGFMGKYRKKKI